MKVIQIDFSAFQQLMNMISEIKEKLLDLESSKPLSDWIDNKELCEILKISVRTAQAYRDKGLIPFSQVGAKIYYRVGDVEEYLLRFRVEAWGNKK